MGTWSHALHDAGWKVSQFDVLVDLVFKCDITIIVNEAISICNYDYISVFIDIHFMDKSIQDYLQKYEEGSLPYQIRYHQEQNVLYDAF